jgi:hypothetical protein
MTRVTYEIHLRGQLPPELAADLGATSRFEAPAETVLVTGPIDQVGMHDLIDRLSDFGLELLELRRCADTHGSTGQLADD